ncbi:Modification methylase CfrBI (N(4)- cytosine-specific methyltransferase CfrBI) (M.CfrBI) [Caldibacillus thermoamylovorans]|uniref:DNA methyltransferase n=1 Tax=Caldibacillus thermoamylovorans TaxID=35841 RepID=UPI0005B702BB|nr:DNA methyltransferase [Caldibacillus thermoamylovorans]KIO60770.1 Modification methylase CfrBI (N(4)- cytosine-specific methyltransferase CfrBI) (M.CfrBI) [Caldibacillus thermoamylovorans]
MKLMETLSVQKAKQVLKDNSNLENDEQIKMVKELVFHENTEIAVTALKILGKLKDKENVNFYLSIINGEYEEKVRKEAVSVLGRMRDYNIAVNYLLNLLDDRNPEIVLQAIRGLLVFKSKTEITDTLKQLINHKNEIVRDIIEKEFFPNSFDFDTKKDHSIVKKEYMNKIINGDALKILRSVENNSIHLTFTSPPYYNARDYSIYSSYEEYLDFLEEVFSEVYRVTKDGRFLIVNTSPIIIPRVGRKYSSKRYPIPYDLHGRLVKQGWEFIDDIIWVKPEASVKNRIGGFQQFRKPLMYKPNAVTEQLMVYRKKSNRLIDWNIRAYEDEVVEASKVLTDFETTNVWEIDPVYDKVHSAVFPKKLCDNVVKYYSMKGDLVFDPFAGSGTLAKSALSLERKVFMTEISKEYFERIMENLSDYAMELEFLDEETFLQGGK